MNLKSLDPSTLPADVAVPLSAIKDRKSAEQLSSALIEYRSLTEQEALLAKAKKLLMIDVDALAKRIGIDRKVEGDGWTIAPIDRGRSTIKAERLLALGVSMKVIEAATVTTSAPGWDIRGKKEREG